MTLPFSLLDPCDTDALNLLFSDLCWAFIWNRTSSWSLCVRALPHFQINIMIYRFGFETLSACRKVDFLAPTLNFTYYLKEFLENHLYGILFFILPVVTVNFNYQLKRAFVTQTRKLFPRITYPGIYRWKFNSWIFFIFLNVWHTIECSQ